MYLIGGAAYGKEISLLFAAYMLFLNLLCLLLYLFIDGKSLNRRVFCHSFFFTVSYLFVHFYYITCLVLEIDIYTTLNIWVDKDVVNHSLFLSSFGYYCFVCFYCLSSSQKDIIKVRKRSDDVIYKWTGKMAVLFFLLFIVFVDKRYLNGYYGIVDPGPLAVYCEYLYLLFGGAYLIGYSKGFRANATAKSTITDFLKGIEIYFIVFIVLDVIMLLRIGDRGPVMYFLLLIFGSYLFSGAKNIKLVYYLPLIWCGVYVMSLISVVRGYDKELGFTEKIALYYSQPNDVENRDNELASSVRTLHWSVSSVPSQYGYTWGWFQLQQLLNVVPGSGSFVSNFINDETKYKSSASFVTYLEQGDNPMSGAGTTCVADFYLDFGLIGVVFGMSLFGLVVKRLENKAYSNSPVSLFVWILVMIYFSKALYIPRSTCLFLLKECVLIYFILSIGAILKGKIRSV
jgi:hypothetical protein